MRIVVLDGFTLNPGDLSWDGLRRLGECVVYDRTDAGDVVQRATGAEIVLTNKTPVTAEALGRLAGLRYIGVLATGYNIVDAQAARSRGIVVTNVPTYGTESVAQTVFAHLLHWAQNVGHHAAGVRDGRWSASVDFCYWDQPLVEVHGLTMGIVGLGRIGLATARIARAFGMQVVACDRPGMLPAEGSGIRMMGLDDLFRESDVVSLHCPLTADTKHLVNRSRLALMKRTAVLINTSRGGLVDEKALAAALNEGSIAGAGLDVLTVEPPPRTNALIGARNCSITPHSAWATVAARNRLMAIAVGNVRSFLAGQPTNVVHP
jgi:glycerate dehydrogenase